MNSPSDTLDFFIGELVLAPFGMLPKGFAPCDGRLLSIKDNSALFSLLGTTYGGDGMSTFALPDLRGRVPIGCGGSDVYHGLGEKYGLPTVNLLPTNMPAHTHNVAAASAPANDTIPEGNFFAASPSHYQTTPNTYMSNGVVAATGGNQRHQNMMPSIALNWLIAVQGYYPSRPLAPEALTHSEGDR